MKRLFIDVIDAEITDDMVQDAIEDALASFRDKLWFLAPDDNILPLKLGALSLCKSSLGNLLGVGNTSWWINNDMMNAMVHICNHYSYLENGDIPHTVAVPSFDSVHFSREYKYAAFQRSENPDPHAISGAEETKKFSDYISDFYGSHACGFLTPVLDVHENKKELPGNIIFPVNITKYHWLYFVAVFKDNSKGFVMSVDYLSDHMEADIETDRFDDISGRRMFLAKYLGMFSEFFPEELSENTLPYCGPKDMFIHGYNEDNDTQDEKCNSFHHYSCERENIGQQTDAINCGLLVIMSMIKTMFIGDIQDNSPLSPSQMDGKN